MTEREDQNPEPEEPSVEDAPEAEAAPEEAKTPEERNAELMDRLMRVTAEFENYRKRVTREQREWADRARERLVLDLLPIQDSFDRAIETAGDAADAASLLEGMKLVHRQLVGALERHGVKPIDALGKPFDPKLHEAFSSRPAEEGEKPGTVVLEIEKGYVMGERTIRATKGIIAVPAEGDAPDSPEEE